MPDAGSVSWLGGGFPLEDLPLPPPCQKCPQLSPQLWPLTPLSTSLEFIWTLCAHARVVVCFLADAAGQKCL